MTTLPPLPPIPPEKVIRGVNAGQDEEALRAWAIAYAEAAVRDALHDQAERVRNFMTWSK